MVPIPLARVRIAGEKAPNVCGVSAHTFVARSTAIAGDQLHGILDAMTLYDNFILCERDGFPDEMIPTTLVGSMRAMGEIKTILKKAQGKQAG